MSDYPREQHDVRESDQVRLAFVNWRDRFPEMTDDQFEREVIAPIVERLTPLVGRRLLASMPWKSAFK